MADDPLQLLLRLGMRVVECGPVLILALVVIVATSLGGFLASGNLANLGFQVSLVADGALGGGLSVAATTARRSARCRP